jgi:hypothetical protein
MTNSLCQEEGGQELRIVLVTKGVWLQYFITFQNELLEFCCLFKTEAEPHVNII